MAGPIKYSDLFDSSLGAGAGEVIDFGKAVASLGREYRAFIKNLDANGQKVVAGLAAVLAQAGALKQQVSNLNLLNDAERTSLAALQAQVGQLVAEQKRLKDAEAGLATTKRVTMEATQGLTSVLKLNRKH